MEEKACPIENTCSFRDVAPIMMDLPYPPMEVSRKNLSHANLLSVDYCGAVSELSTIARYINNENRISCVNCSVAKTILGIAIAEMMHLQKLGEMIVLLGGDIDFVAKYQDNRRRMWTPQYLTLPEQLKAMLLADMEGEKKAIEQYTMHMHMIDDPCVNATLARIIKDEEYHIMILQTLLNED